MRIMMMHKNQPSVERGDPPSKEIVDKMGAFIGTYAQNGKLIDGAGLGASKTRTRLTFRGGQCVAKHGPYKGEHELPAAALLLKVNDRDEAMRWAERYGKILGDGEVEIGKVTEPWDLGLVPEPPVHPLQVLLIEKADKATESTGRSPQQKAALTRLKSEMTDAGVLQRGYTLGPSSKGKRLTFADNKLQVFDGPFAESKELLGGFAIMDLPSVGDAVEICGPYAAILGGTLEMDIRVVTDD